MRTPNLAGTILAGTFVALAVLSACTDALRAGSDGPPDPAHFDGPDAALPEASAPLTMCNVYQCPAPYATCPDKSGVCNTNLQNDVEHCGACDVKCPAEAAGLDAFFICADSQCRMLCQQNRADCDHLVDNGCEAALDSDAANCGACGAACAAGEICWQGACGCPPGQTLCGKECVRLTNDEKNCGACGNACDSASPDTVGWSCGEGVIPDGAGLLCVNSKCQTKCQTGRADCNGSFCTDGCEAATTDDPKNCGACGKACTDAQICRESACLCDPGQTLCSFSCVDLQSDVRNCGACGNVCPGGDAETGNPICVLGRCSYLCSVGYADCDGRLENGCEVDTTLDPQHCGACDTQCDLAGGQPCIAGKCLTGPCEGVVK